MERKVENREGPWEAIYASPCPSAGEATPLPHSLLLVPLLEGSSPETDWGSPSGAISHLSLALVGPICGLGEMPVASRPADRSYSVDKLAGY